MSSFKFVSRGSAYARVASETDTLLFCAPLAVQSVSDSKNELRSLALVHGYERATLALRVLASLIHHLIYQLIHAHPLVHSLPGPPNQQTKCRLADA